MSETQNECEKIKITRDLLDSGRSSRGAWSKAQVVALGVAYPPKHGWPKRLIGTFVDAVKVRKFLSLKDEHLPASKRRPILSSCEPIQREEEPSILHVPRKEKPLREESLADGFVVVKTQAGLMCEAVLRTIYPMRELFTRAQIQDAGYFIKRIGYDKTCQIADWAARKASIKDGRYRMWMSVCRKEIAARTQNPEASHDPTPT